MPGCRLPPRHGFPSSGDAVVGQKRWRNGKAQVEQLYFICRDAGDPSQKSTAVKAQRMAAEDNLVMRCITRQAVGREWILLSVKNANGGIPSGPDEER